MLNLNFVSFLNGSVRIVRHALGGSRNTKISVGTIRTLPMQNKFFHKLKKSATSITIFLRFPNVQKMAKTRTNIFPDKFYQIQWINTNQHSFRAVIVSFTMFWNELSCMYGSFSCFSQYWLNKLCRLKTNQKCWQRSGARVFFRDQHWM